MAEFNYAEELNTDVDYDYITDVMTGDRDARMHLYFQLLKSFQKAESVDIIVSFLMESGVNMLIKHLGNALKHGAKIRLIRKFCKQEISWVAFYNDIHGESVAGR